VKRLGQFCSIARSLDVLGQRWSLLIVREVLLGSRRFGDVRRGIPRISRTMLSARLRELVDLGVLERHDGKGGPTYDLTSAGRELEAVVRNLGVWGQRWLPRTLPREELDADALLWDVQRRVRGDALPAEPILIRLELSSGRSRTDLRYLLLRQSEVSLCAENPGFPEQLRLRSSVHTLTAWWRGDLSFADARATDLTIEGPRELVRAFPSWFLRYAFADVASALA
jgi:DNA-binding HxlR family transcriptional regulator